MFIKQAKYGLTNWWRYVIVFFVAFALNFIASLPMAVATLISSIQGKANLQEFSATADPTALGLGQVSGFFLMIAPLSIVFIGLAWTIKMVHGYSWRQVFTSYSKFRWKNYFIAALLWFVLLALADVVYYYYHPESYSFHSVNYNFVLILILSIIFIPLQSAWEELYFRGNLMQGLGLLTRTRIIPLIITAVLFGLVHSLNPEVKKYGFSDAMFQYMGFGILLGVAVIMDGGLEMSFGIHTINNIYASVFVSYSGSVLNTPALISSNQNDTRYMAWAFVVAAAIFLVAVKYLFKWKSFKWLFSKVSD